MQRALRVYLAMAVTALVGLVMASPSWAANKDNSWEIGAFLPFVIFDDPEIDGVEVDADDAVGFAVRGAYNIKRAHEIEFTYAMIPTEAEADVPGFGTVEGDVDLTIWQFGYIYNFEAGENLVPFVGGGFGSANTDVEDADDEDDTLIHAGGGIRWFFNDTFGLRFEGGAESVDADPDRLNHMYVGAGVTFVVGG